MNNPGAGMSTPPVCATDAARPGPLSAALLAFLTAHCRGRENARSTDDLCAWFHCSRRELQKAREALEDDHPILSGQEGYWLALSPDEYAEVLVRDQKELKADARRYAKRRRVMLRTWPNFQASLFDEVV